MSANNTLRGRKKGGAMFPQIALSQAVEFANKLVAKVHTGPQPEKVILKGVFNNVHSDGKIRASALKQFGLMSGLSSAYDATSLARSIHSAPEDEKSPLLAKACLTPKLFKTLYDTFQSDVVSRAKIRQQALQLKVHPETGEKCVTIFIASLIYAGLAKDRLGGDIEIVPASHLHTNNSVAEAANSGQPASEIKIEDDDDSTDEDTSEPDDVDADVANDAPPNSRLYPSKINSIPKAQFQVALNLDTMDPEKLEKHMKILKRYGVIG